MKKKKNSINDAKQKKEKKKGWNYLAVKKLSTLLRGITSKHLGDFYCLNCRYSFRI